MQKPKILIVDDEKETRKILKDHLSQRIECQLFECSDGDQVLSLIKGDCFDLVILDIRMPGLSGLDLIRQLHENNPTVYILVISAWDDSDIIQEAIKQGAHDFLHKPLSLKAITLKIKHALMKIDKYIPLKK